MDQAAEDFRLLALDAETGFVHATNGRILRTGSPDGGQAPRVFFAGCAGGTILRIRQDVSDQTAADLEALATAEPPWVDPQALPACLAAMIERLSRDAPAEAAAPALYFQLPKATAFSSDVAIIRSDTPQGGRLLARLARDGMPPHLAAAGFAGLTDFWAPWCAAMAGEDIAALCFAARLGPRGAAVGIYTFPGYRGRGLAAAVTAAWSAMPALAERTLSYSALRTNRSSLRVAERLGLRRFGLSVSIA